MADTTCANRGYLYIGAERFHTLLQALRTETARQLDERMADVEAGIDVRDYQQLAMMINEAIPLSLDIREGFMRALADVLACFADGATFNIDEPMRLDPIDDRTTSEPTADSAAAPSAADAKRGLRHYGMRKAKEPDFDFYSGSLDDLVALGFIPRERFPGEPGQPLTKVSLRPAGVSSARTYWHLEPGYVTVSRTASGRYQMRVAIPYEVREARAEARELIRSYGVERCRLALYAMKPQQPRLSHLRLAWSAGA